MWLMSTGVRFVRRGLRGFAIFHNFPAQIIRVAADRNSQCINVLCAVLCNAAESKERSHSEAHTQVKATNLNEHVVANITGIGALHAPKVKASSLNEHIVASITGIGALHAPKVKASSLNEHIVANITGIGALHAPKVKATSLNEHVVANITGIGALHAPKVKASSLNEHVVANITGIGALHAPKVKATSLNEHIVANISGIGALHAPKVKATSLNEHFVANITGIGALHAPKVKATNLNEHIVANISGIGALHAPKVKATSLNEHFVANITGIGALHAPKVKATSLNEHIVANISGIGALHAPKVKATSLNEHFVANISGIGALHAPKVKATSLNEHFVANITGIGALHAPKFYFTRRSGLTLSPGPLAFSGNLSNRIKNRRYSTGTRTDTKYNGHRQDLNSRYLPDPCPGPLGHQLSMRALTAGHSVTVCDCGYHSTPTVPSSVVNHLHLGHAVSGIWVTGYVWMGIVTSFCRYPKLHPKVFADTLTVWGNVLECNLESRLSVCNCMSWRPVSCYTVDAISHSFWTFIKSAPPLLFCLPHLAGIFA
ncbi:hypothetical protein J6590_026969 [Homalodisca vitripennis]|nr:hypothetical protein J6590_026969 [Homalodisca vitripennis]